MRGTLAVALLAVLSASLVLVRRAPGAHRAGLEVEETNGDQGAFHFVMNAFDLHIGYPENVRVERIEKRTIKLSGGATREEERVRKVRVILARCESRSILRRRPPRRRQPGGHRHPQDLRNDQALRAGRR